MSTVLPPRLARLVEEVLEHADAATSARSRGARERIESARADLEQHFLDGLARGRTVEELVERFGDPAVAGRLLARSPAPADRSPSRGGASHGNGGEGPFRDWMHDVRHALRGLARTPTLAATAIVVLAIGVGANTVVFTVLNELLLRPIPVENPETLVDVWADIPGGNSFLGVAYQDYLTYRNDNEVLAELVAFTGRRLEMDRGGEPEVVVGQFVGPGYFEMLGLRAGLGRIGFGPDARPGDGLVVVLSHAFWTESFGADPAVVGRTLRLQGHTVTVQGVGPPGFAGHFIGFPSDLWLPLAAADPLLAGWDANDRARKELEMIGRLRPGVTVETARAGLNGIAEEIERRYPELNRGHRLGVTPTTGLDHSLQAAVTAFVAILGAVSLLVLIIACLNVGSVLLVRAMSRDRELAVRIALGAGRGRLLRQLGTESAVLVGLGTLAGTVVAVRLNHAIADLLRVLAAGVGLELAVDWRVLALTGATALAASILAGVAPAVHVFRKDPAGVLRSRGGPSRGSARMRTGLVVGQVAVSVVLVIATGLFVRALVAGQRAHPGFDAERVATFQVELPPGLSPEGRRAEGRAVLDALRALPVIDQAVIASAPPVGVARSPIAIEVPGVQPPPDADRHVVDGRTVGAGYLGVVGTPLLAGRDIQEADEGDGDGVAVVSRAFAERFWPEASALGATFVVGAGGEAGSGVDREVRVVGIAADARYLVQDDTPDPLVYLSRPSERSAERTPGRPAEPSGERTAEEARAVDTGDGRATTVLVTVRALDPLTVGDAVQRVIDARVAGHRRIRLRTARQVLDDALLPQRLGTAIIGAMGIAALFLAAVGLYGLIQFTVTRDTHELGVRLALGGGRGDLFMVVLRKGVSLVAIGTAVGVGLALLLAPGLAGFLGGVSPADPFTYAAVVACFAVVALLASWLPARRALRIPATEALRGE